MKRKIVVLFITLFAIAAIGLIMIQVVQTSRMASISNNLFTISVNNAMDNVIDELDRMKLEDYISQNDRYRLLKYKRVEEINEKLKCVVKEHADLFFDETKVDPCVSLQDSVVPHSNANLSSADSAAINTYNTLLATRERLTRGDDYYDRFVTEMSEYIVNNIMSNTKFNYEHLDEIIVQELVVNGIDIKPNMAVISSHNNEFLYCNAEGKEKQLLESPYRYSFHPTGLTDAQEYFIVLQFPRTLYYSDDDNQLFALMSIVLIIIIIVLFGISLRTIANQRRLDEMKNDFINNMTHEIKTPITNIGLACEMLHEPSISSDASLLNEYLNVIGDENRRMRILVETILQSSKMANKNFSLNLRQTDIHNIIEVVSKSFHMQIANRQGSLQLDLRASDHLLTIDELHITNMVFNLIDNAIKYSPTTVDIIVSTLSTPQSFVLKVADKGLGISKEDQKHIFEKFYRVSTGNVHNVKGFGIGLNYVSQVVALHQGRIEVESELGMGTTFIVTIPIM